MKINKLSRLFQVSLAAVVLAVCASASAGTAKRNVAPKHYQGCYVIVSGTNVPQPCERFRGAASTASPMDIIGEVKMYHVASK